MSFFILYCKRRGWIIGFSKCFNL